MGDGSWKKDDDDDDDCKKTTAVTVLPKHAGRDGKEGGTTTRVLPENSEQ